MNRSLFAVAGLLLASGAALAQLPAGVPPPAPPPFCRPLPPSNRAALANLLANPAALRAALCAEQSMFFFGSFADEYYRRFLAPRIMPIRPPEQDPYQPPEPQYIVADGPVATRPEQAQVTLEVPAMAHVWVEGEKQEFRGTAVRVVSPDLTPGKLYTYAVRVQWMDGKVEVKRELNLPVVAGDRKVLTVVGKSR